MASTGPISVSPVDSEEAISADSTDEVELDPEVDGTPEIEVPFDPTKIDIIVKTMTIGSLQTRLENEELDLTPEFQRQANVWNAKRKARLIESILLRIPLPSFYFSEDKDGSYAVVDGLQRLCSIFHFMNRSLLAKATNAALSDLRLNELQYLKELEGLSFGGLDRKFQRRVSELEITANIIRANTPPAVKFNVFARLNQGGMPLTAQEIRNAIFPGRWRDRVRGMAESSAFLRATDGKVPKDRQQDIELVLRFVSLWQLGEPFKRPVGQTLDEFLNAAVEQQLTTWTDDQWQRAESAFYRSLEVARSIFGRHTFRKSAGYERRKPINRGLFEAQLIACWRLSPEEVEKVLERSSDAAALFSKALDDDIDFNQSLLYATGSPGASNTRIWTIARIFGEILSAESNAT
jgi:hypothetical protein